MRILLTGADGQLAKEFIKNINPVDLYSFSKEKLDISIEKDVRESIRYVKPDILINCAAYNDVDRAESEFDIASSINSKPLIYFSKYCYEYKTKIIHFSTDYVFDGNKKELYRETDNPNPINNYGRTKLEGEENLKGNYENYIIFRVSWVYGEGKQNFISKLLKWSKNSNKLKISTDEISIPNSTSFIVGAAMKAINNDLTGVMNLVSSNWTSRYNWAKRVIEILKINIEIEEAKQKDFNLPAKRPFFSALNNENIRKTLGIEIKNWDEYLNEFLNRKKEFFYD